MPSYEETSRLTSQKKVPLAINDLKVFLLFVCPACDSYTIHRPRLSDDGHWYVDHKREPVYQLDIDGKHHFVGLAPADSCFVDDNHIIFNIPDSRTVIRVKQSS